MPNSFHLSQNYPNPFNPSTVISFSVPQEGIVTLRVYDLLGRVVAKLMNEQKEPGQYSVTWDASMMPSGMYLYQLNAGGVSQIQKMLLVR